MGAEHSLGGHVVRLGPWAEGKAVKEPGILPRTGGRGKIAGAE